MTVSFVQSAQLAAVGGIRHAFFTRTGGVSQGIYATLNGGHGSDDELMHVTENRARMADALAVSRENFVTAYQSHSTNVVIAEKPWARASAPRADAIVTAAPGLAVAVGIADCGPVLFADGEAKVVGATHAGWKGALDGVIESTVAAMEKLGARRERIVAAIGPLIRQPSYEVGPEFVARFRAADATHEKYFTPSPLADHAQFDLPGFIAARIAQAGIGTVDDLGLDTYADEARFFSYRRTTHRGEPDYGRLIAAIALS